MSTSNLPEPRLQLRWEPLAADRQFNWLCHYELVLPLDKYDIRRENYDKDGERLADSPNLVVAMKPPTKRGGMWEPCRAQDGQRFCDAPYRDGAHASWDAKHLGNLPMYVIAPDGMAFLDDRDAAGAPT